MSKNANYLKSVGLTNFESEDYGTLASSKERTKIPVAYCTSDKCCSLGGSKRLSKIYKNVHSNTTYCPNCRSSLLWKMQYEGQINKSQEDI